MTNEINPTEEKVLGDFTRAEVATLQSTIAQGTTREQFNLFMQTCVNSGLNPFMNHIYPIVYGGKMSLQVSVEGILHLARQHEDFEGVESQVICEKDEFKMSRIDGQMQIVTHNIGFPRGRVVGAYAIARRKGYKDVIILQEASEVEHMTKGRNKNMWTSYYNDMFKKHVMKRAAKEQFGIELGGEEQAIVQGETESKEVESDRVQTGENEFTNLEENRIILVNKACSLANEKGIDFDLYTKEKFGGKLPNKLSGQQTAALLRFLEMEQNRKIVEAEFEEVEQKSLFDEQ